MTRGKVAIVVDCDYEWLSQWKWHANRVKSNCGDLWYAVRTDYSGEKRREVYMHREIAAKAGLPQVDHKDGDGLHNWRSNLRPCTRSQNQGNSRKRLGCSSRFKGVCWNKVANMWQVCIKPNGHQITIGYSHNENEAALMYDIAAMEHFGKFARLNFVYDHEL